MTTTRSPLVVGSLTVAVGAALFGLLGLLSRWAYDLGLSPFAFVAWRAGVGAIVIAGFVWWAARRRRALVPWATVPVRARVALGTAALMGTVLNIAMFVAFERAPIAIVLLGFYLYPAIVAAAAAALGWEPLDRWRFAALLIALGGMVAVVAGGANLASLGGAGGLDPLGVGLSVVAALSQAVFVLVSRHAYREVPTEQAMATLLLVAAVAAGSIAVAVGGPGAMTLPFGDAELLGLLLLTGLFGAAIPSSLFLSGIRTIGAVRAGILMLIEPLVGVALAAAFLAEAIGPIQAAGGAAILLAAIIIQRSQGGEPTITPAGEPEPDHHAGGGLRPTPLGGGARSEAIE